MRIDRVRCELGPLKGRDIKLAPGLNVIRGDNGVGKTLLLEACALLGHCSILDVEHRDVPTVTLRVFLDDAEKQWLRRICADAGEAADFDAARRQIRSIPNFGGDRELKEAIVARLDDTQKKYFTIAFSESKPESLAADDFNAWCATLDAARLLPATAEIRRIFETCVKGPCEACSELAATRMAALAGEMEAKGAQLWRLSEQYSSQYSSELPSLRAALSDEAVLMRYWRINNDVSVSKTSDADIAVLQLLVAYSRPQSDSPTHVEGTLRKRWLDRLDDGERGASTSLGRPSDIVGVEDDPVPGFVCYFNTDMYDFGIGLDVRESPKTVGRSMRRMLARLYAARPHRFRRHERIIAALRRIVDFNKEISLDDDGLPVIEDRPRKDPLSSGENQVLFLCLILVALAPRNSIILLDEADIHLSVSSVANAMEFLRSLAEDNGCQIVAVTHLDLSFERAWRHFNDSGWDHSSADHVALIFLKSEIGSLATPLHGDAAVLEMWPTFKKGIDKQLMGARRLADEYPILSFKPGISWLKRLSRNPPVPPEK